MAWSQDSKYLVSASDDKTCKIWEAATVRNILPPPLISPSPLPPPHLPLTSPSPSSPPHLSLPLISPSPLPPPHLPLTSPSPSSPPHLSLPLISPSPLPPPLTSPLPLPSGEVSQDPQGAYQSRILLQLQPTI